VGRSAAVTLPRTEHGADGNVAYFHALDIIDFD
jgi:hypothetical protein